MLFKEGLKTVMFFCFTRIEEHGKEGFFLKDFVQLCIWKTWEMQHVNGKTINVKLRKLKSRLFYETFYSVSLPVILCSNMS